MQSFWQKLAKPIIGLSPMDGVTDAPFRHIVAKIGKPDVIFTEFVNVEGLGRGAIKLLRILLYSKIERPIVAQLFGASPEDFYKAALMVCELGFDGVDINMGCPANNVTKGGGGAALIKNSDLAKKIIQAVKNGVDDWADGKNLKNTGIDSEILKWIDTFLKKEKIKTSRKILPVSVKTRLGYDSDISEKWISFLSEQDVDVISLHGRTLKQMYQGQADWGAISKSAKIVHDAGKIILGNGDIKSVLEVEEKCKLYRVDGVLVGRATWGNPWFFNKKKINISRKEKLETLLEQILYFKKMFEEKHFSPLKKHIAHYVKNFDGALEVRQKLLSAKSFNEFEEMITKIV